MDRKEAVKLVKKGKSEGKMDQDLKKELISNGFDPIDAGQLVLDAPDEEVKEDEKDPGKPMKIRSPIIVAFLTVFTLFIYGVYWLIKTTGELRERNDSAPNPKLLYLLLLPGVNIIVMILYFWKYTRSLSSITGSNVALIFIFLLLFFPIGVMMCQIDINNTAIELQSKKNIN
ncbi:MAG: hypothetical protein ACLFTR_04170 [Candidatus Woesearchaeota archaeon]